MAREIMYTARTKYATVTTANPNLNGSGTINTLITAQTNGTLVKTLIIKAQESTGQGIIRFFIIDGITGSAQLLMEFNLSVVTDSPRDPAFYKVIPFDYFLESGDSIGVSISVNKIVNVIAEALDVSYYSTFREDTITYTAKTGSGLIKTANPNRDGTGIIVSIFDFPGGYGYSGCAISSIIVKGQQTTSPGTVRFFTLDSTGGPWVLFAELPIPAITQGFDLQTFSRELISFGNMTLEEGFSIGASTETNEEFSVVISGANWQYL
jgi:hypothetical protein